MSWSALFCSLLGCYQQDHIPEHCMLTVSTLTRETRSQTHAWVRAHAHWWVNALTQTRESPTERLFRGITWLLGNSVVLPHRPGYFRLLICLFFLLWPCVWVRPVTVRISMRHGCCPILCLFMHSVLKYFILVLILLWVICKGSNPCGRCSTGVLMGSGGDVAGQFPRALQVPLFLMWLCLPFCNFCTWNILRINFLSPPLSFPST